MCNHYFETKNPRTSRFDTSINSSSGGGTKLSYDHSISKTTSRPMFSKILMNQRDAFVLLQESDRPAIISS